MQKADPLIRTKLHLPFIRPGLVSLIVDPPVGSGKTTLVTSCVMGCGMPVASLSFDKDDNLVPSATGAPPVTWSLGLAAALWAVAGAVAASNGMITSFSLLTNPPSSR
jgi:hypothetical protein